MNLQAELPTLPSGDQPSAKAPEIDMDSAGRFAAPFAATGLTFAGVLSYAVST